MPRTIQEIKNLSPRFRILVIGRRNAGKTTILKKMCDSDGSDLQIVDANGKQDQIHAVWFCIPMDEQRAPSAQFELAFFNARESPVPIIAVCTKFEALLDSEMSGEDDSSDAEEEARQAAQSKFDRTVLQALRGTSHPPDQIVQLQNLDEPTAGCAALTERTYAAIHDKTLSDLFALAQHNSFSVGCTKVLQAMTPAGRNACARAIMKHSKLFANIQRATCRCGDIV
ncbi:hypothetical protein B0H16DRAFT_231529 [Mycena metata]|uniref:G domain-containing protein n=1 Tax=Mycena metata TaxID=1033252 RepID=A0AAD7MSR9_9AGAR|nr:hypothetical protein B0H16DRAFT_231529 [Mycena metata]